MIINGYIMKAPYRLILSCFIIGLIASCSPPAYKNTWQSKAVVVDGKSKEWTIPLRFYDNKSKLQYSFSNDMENLYFCIRATNEPEITKILHAGMQILIETKERNKQQALIKFPLANRMKFDFSQETGRSTKKELGFTRKKMVAAINEMELSGFKPPTGGLMTTNNSFGIVLQLGLDTLNDLIYEGIIPFKTFYKDKLTPSDSSVSFNITMLINAMDTRKMKVKNEEKSSENQSIENESFDSNMSDRINENGTGGNPLTGNSIYGNGMDRQGMRGSSMDHDWGQLSSGSNPLGEKNTIKFKLSPATGIK